MNKIAKVVAILSLLAAPLGTFAFDGEVDHCGNIEGIQETVPVGFARLNNVCKPISGGGGSPSCLRDGTCPCLGSSGTALTACRAQFYPAHCEELAPRDVSQGFLVVGGNTEIQCARWASGYEPVVVQPVAIAGTANDIAALRASLISLIQQLIAELQRQLDALR